jgi:hypothetical protein
VAISTFLNGTMKKTYRKHSPAFKTKAVLEALKEPAFRRQARDIERTAPTARAASRTDSRLEEGVPGGR